MAPSLTSAAIQSSGELLDQQSQGPTWFNKFSSRLFLPRLGTRSSEVGHERAARELLGMQTYASVLVSLGSCQGPPCSPACAGLGDEKPRADAAQRQVPEQGGPPERSNVPIVAAVAVECNIVQCFFAFFASGARHGGKPKSDLAAVGVSLVTCGGPQTVGTTKIAGVSVSRLYGSSPRM